MRPLESDLRKLCGERSFQRKLRAIELDLADLPEDVDVLHGMIRELAAAHESERAETRAEIERLRQMVKMT